MLACFSSRRGIATQHKLAANSMKQSARQELGRERAMSPGKVLGFHQVEQPNALDGRELLGEDLA
jgi:hypothetical protein